MQAPLDTTARPIDHATILVRSLALSLPYYRALLPLLGYRESAEGSWTGKGFTLQLGEAKAGSRPYDRHGPGLNHLGFALPTREAVAAVGERMASLGFEVPPIQAFGRSSALFMKDPDGLRFEITHHGS